MFPKRLFFVLLIAALVAVTVLAARVPLANGQGAQPTKVELTPYEGNPVLPRGAAGEWDSGVVFGGAVFVHEKLFHMFYTGDDVDLRSNSAPVPAIGYATSEDGLHWTKYEGNPVLEADPSLSPGGFLFAVPLVEGDTWVLYLTTGQTPGQWGGKVFRATAPAPTGPWTVDSQPILEPGAFADWDHSIYPSSLVRTESEYVLYYLGASSSSSITIGLGRATSSDGITWTKYDDPATTEALYAHSDPVYSRGKAGSWDGAGLSGGVVILGEHGWELFYDGTRTTAHWMIGYATSADGITWTPYGSNPILDMPEAYAYVPDSVVVVGDSYYLYHNVVMVLPDAIDLQEGVSIGTLTWE
jgi:hypothetical protein